MMLDYYGELRPREGQMMYVPDAAPDRRGPEWFLTQRVEGDAADRSPAATIVVKAVESRLVRSFPYGGISGWTWHLYHTINSDANRAGSAGSACRPDVQPGR